ncbi:MAG TPA: helix-turn-helix domain-containing protein, partial [Burkholderiaceae bacterium]
MSERDLGLRSSEAAAGEAATSGAAATAGAWLRQARQAQGMHIAVLAATLKVSQRKLEAIEGDRYQELSDLAFARALAQAMCRALKLDAAKVLALLPAVGEPELERVSRGLNQPFRERATRDEGINLALLKSPAIWGPALIVAAAVGLYFVPSSWLDQVSSWMHTSTASAPTAVETTVPANAASAIIEVPAQNVVGKEADAPASQPALEPAVAVGTSPAVAAPAVTPKASAAAPSSAASGAELVISARADSWVEVT